MKTKDICFKFTTGELIENGVVVFCPISKNKKLSSRDYDMIENLIEDNEIELYRIEEGIYELGYDTSYINELKDDLLSLGFKEEPTNQQRK